MQSLMTWRWSSWAFCAPEVSPILGKVKVHRDHKPLKIHGSSSYLLISSCSTVFQEFVRFSNKDIEQIIKKEMSGDVKNAFYAIGNNGLTMSMFHNPLDADLLLFVLQFVVLRTNLPISQTAYTRPWRYLFLKFDMHLDWRSHFWSRQQPNAQSTHCRALERMTGRWSVSWCHVVRLTFLIFAKNSKKHMMPPFMNSSR